MQLSDLDIGDEVVGVVTYELDSADGGATDVVNVDAVVRTVDGETERLSLSAEQKVTYEPDAERSPVYYVGAAAKGSLVQDEGPVGVARVEMAPEAGEWWTVDIGEIDPLEGPDE